MEDEPFFDEDMFQRKLKLPSRSSDSIDLTISEDAD